MILSNHLLGCNIGMKQFQYLFRLCAILAAFQVVVFLIEVGVI